ncbi:hypothetical protein HDU81_001425, partial [Chytriomyces hyalinus]
AIDQAIKRYEQVEKAHGQWVSLLKETIDPVDLSVTIALQNHFGAMLDKLFLQSNSQNSLDMTNEWEHNWKETEGQFPINLMLWHKLCKCHFAINKGYTPEVDAALCLKFKHHVLDVICDNREYAPLTLSIHNDQVSNMMASAEILSQLKQLAQLDALEEKQVKA